MAHCSGIKVKLLIAAFTAVVISTAASAKTLVNTADCIDADITLRAEKMSYFSEADSQVCLLEGNSAILFGPRKLSAEKMVLWIYTRELHGRFYRRIDVYLTGAVKISEPGGSVVEDSRMLVMLKQTGHFTANVQQVFADQGSESMFYITSKRNRQAHLAGLKQAPVAPSLDVSDIVVDNKYDASQLDDAALRPLMPLKPQPAQPQPQHDSDNQQLQTEPAPQTQQQQPAIGPTAAVGDIDITNIKVVRKLQPVRFSADEVKLIVEEDQNNNIGQQTIICRGNLHISYGGRNQIPAIDVQADCGVLLGKRTISDNKTSETGTDAEDGAAAATETLAQRSNISAAYLEGDVRMISEDRVIRAKQLFLDFETEQAVLTDIVANSVLSDRRIPIYARAKKARMLTRRNEIGEVISRDIELESPKLSISEFYSPTYYIGASTVIMRDTTLRNSDGKAEQSLTGSMKIYNPAAFVYGIPVAYWPYLASDRKLSDIPLSRMNITRHSELGQGVETRWKLLNLLGLNDPEGFDTQLELGNYSDGPAVGIDIDYKRDNYTGYFEGTFLRDNDGYKIKLWDEETPVATNSRYSYLWRHKYFIGNGWEMQHELFNQRGDLVLEMRRGDYWEDVPRSNFIYLRKQQNNWAVNATAQAGIMEHDNVELKRNPGSIMPDFVFAPLNPFTGMPDSSASLFAINDLVYGPRAPRNNDWLLPQVSGELVGQDLFYSTLTLFADATAAIRKADQANTQYHYFVGPFFGQYENIREDKIKPEASARTELNLPVKFGPVNTVAAIGTTAGWEDYDENQLYSLYGSVKANTTFWRVWQGASCKMLNIYKLRHLVTPEVVYYHNRNLYNNELRYNGLEWVSKGNDRYSKSHNYGTSIRLKQRWQTYRGAKGNREVVDLAGLNVAFDSFSVDMYPKKPEMRTVQRPGRFFFDRPELSNHNNNINADMYFNFSSDTALLADAAYLTDDHYLQYANFGFAVQRNPRFRYYLGGRYYDSKERDYDSFVGTAGFTYNLGRKYQVNIFQQYDFEYSDGQNLQTRITLLRSFPRWKAAISLVSDEAIDAKSVEFSLYPEGMPKSQLGNKVSTWQASAY